MRLNGYKALARVERELLFELSDEQAKSQTDALLTLSAEQYKHFPRLTSGLVEQQKRFMQIHQKLTGK